MLLVVEQKFQDVGISRIYKTVTRPSMTCTTQTRLNTAKIKRMLETGEMKVLQGTAGETLMNRERSRNIRRECEVGAEEEEKMERAHETNVWGKTGQNSKG